MMTPPGEILIDELTIELDLVDLAVQAVDGTKIAANAAVIVLMTPMIYKDH